MEDYPNQDSTISQLTHSQPLHLRGWNSLGSPRRASRYAPPKIRNQRLPKLCFRAGLDDREAVVVRLHFLTTNAMLSQYSEPVVLSGQADP